MEKDSYCGYFLKHTKTGGGDEHVFLFRGVLCCDKLDCANQQDAEPLQYQGEGNYFRRCLSEGKK